MKDNTMNDTDEFDWDVARENGSIVQSNVKRIAIYDNPNGDLVIRQEPPDFQDEDVFIVIGKNNVDAVIAEMRALQALSPAVKAPLTVAPDASGVASNRPAPMTPAERQRKRRALSRQSREGHEVRDVDVT
jgi:hypothetical protein